jgi:ATP synthase protein I
VRSISVRNAGATPIPKLDFRAFVMQQAVKRLRVIKWLLGLQAAGALGAGLVGLLMVDITAGKSALIGGLICWLPNCYFALRAFRHRGARAARLIIRSFYAGQAGKMVMSAVMFAVTFIYVKPINPLALFAGYVGVQVLNWIVPLIASGMEAKRSTQ